MEDGTLMNIKAGSYLGTAGTLVFTSTTEDDDGLFLRLGAQGGVTGYRAVNQDLEWKAQDTTSMNIDDDVWISVLSLTVDHDVTTANGSFAFYASVDNTSSNRDANITVQFKADGTVIGTPPMIVVDKGDLGRPINMFGSVGENVASGATITIEIYSTEILNLRGDISPTTLKVIEAQAAPITAAATAIDVLVVPIVPSNEMPPKQNILDALGSTNQIDLMATDFRALVTDNNRFFQVSYDAKSDTFFGNEIYPLS